MRHGQQMHIVVPQDRDSLLSEFPHEPQYFQRVRSTVHQIPGKPQLVPGAIKGDRFQEGEQRRKTSLHIPDRIHSHAALLPTLSCTVPHKLSHCERKAYHHVASQEGLSAGVV
jgi:hypothetical protein